MSTLDVEKAVKSPRVSSSSAVVDAATGEIEEYPTFLSRFQGWTAWTGAEQRGAAPVPIDQRTHTDYISIFTVFSTPMLSLLP